MQHFKIKLILVYFKDVIRIFIRIETKLEHVLWNARVVYKKFKILLKDNFLL